MDHIERLVPRLVFDSFRDPLPVGIRSGEPIVRQVLYEAGPYSIDLRFDHDRGSRRVWLTGQIASDQPDRHVDRLTVWVTAGAQPAAQACTNNHGEFQLDYEPHPELQLHIGVQPREQIELPLEASAGASTTEDER
jgi:hypothetical protein